MQQERTSYRRAPRPALRRDAGRARPSLRTREVFRIAATLDRATVAREIILEWLEHHAKTDLPEPSWNGETFHHTSGDCSFAAIRAKTPETDLWGIRFIEKEADEAEREWTTEVVLREREGHEADFSLRKLAKSHESKLRVSPTAPPFLEHVAKECAMEQGAAKLEKDPWVVESEFDAASLTEFLVDPDRKTPAFVLTVPEDAEDPNEPLLDAASLAADTLGLAKVIVLPAEYTWKLTNRFGKRLSVYRGAMRVYLTGFNERSDPEGGNDLFMPHRMETQESAAKLISLLRWIAARESLRGFRLGQDVLSFLSVLLPSIDLEAAALRDEDAGPEDQLNAAIRHNALLRAELLQSLHMQQSQALEAQALESRLRDAESKLRRSFRPRPMDRGRRPPYGGRPQYDRRGPAYDTRRRGPSEGRGRRFEDRGRPPYGERSRRPYGRDRERSFDRGGQRSWGRRQDDRGFDS